MNCVRFLCQHLVYWPFCLKPPLFQIHVRSRPCDVARKIAYNVVILEFVKKKVKVNFVFFGVFYASLLVA